MESCYNVRCVRNNSAEMLVFERALNKDRCSNCVQQAVKNIGRGNSMG